MRTKNARAIDRDEAEHMARVKSCRCVVCAKDGPSFAHHMKQGLHFCVIALCWECHQGSHGIHGDKSRWRVAHMTEIEALNETLRLIQPGRGERFSVAPQPRKPSPMHKRGSSLSSTKCLPRREVA